MSIRTGLRATHRLTRAGFELAPQRGHGALLAWVMAVLLAAAAGFGAGYLQWGQAATSGPALAAALQGQQQLQQRLEQARLALGLAEARGHELERQIDTLNQRLQQSQDELTFFRKTREGKR
ncbi:hypothetical protein [Ideonella sp. BN130291]|uniref:hypothetical protein n=1 Tax=Ideonella sp. BN130291 TaxID=3112940 RepID=UPI002E257A1D|nr:hypothetical protein [Ideonella sp. BN130291]